MRSLVLRGSLAWTPAPQDFDQATSRRCSKGSIKQQKIAKWYSIPETPHNVNVPYVKLAPFEFQS
jgi:hypothetical protein